MVSKCCPYLLGEPELKGICLSQHFFLHPFLLFSFPSLSLHVLLTSLTVFSVSFFLFHIDLHVRWKMM